MSKPGRIGPFWALGLSLGSRIRVTRSAVRLSIDSLLYSHAPGAQSSLILGEVRNTPRPSETRTFLSCDLPKIDPSMRPMRMLRPEAVSNRPSRSTMKRCPGALSSRTSAPANRNRSAMKAANSSLSNRRGQSRRSRRRGGSDPSAMATASATLERLAERNGDGERAVALLAVQRHADIDADRAETGIITRSDARREMPVLDVRRGLRRQGATVEEG